MTVWLDFFLQVFVHALAWCFAVIASLGVVATAFALLGVIRSLGAAR